MEGAKFQLPAVTRDLPFFRAVFPNLVIRADDLARAMVDVVVRGAGKSRTLVLENCEIRQWSSRFTFQTGESLTQRRPDCRIANQAKREFLVRG